MDYTDDILKNKRYKEQIDKLSSETLQLISNDDLQALEAAQKGIRQEEPEKLDDTEYLQTVADVMQKLARRVLKEREGK